MDFTECLRFINAILGSQCSTACLNNINQRFFSINEIYTVNNGNIYTFGEALGI